MNVLSKRALRQFWERHPAAEGPLKAWYYHVLEAQWQTPQDIKAVFGSNVDFLSDNRVIFDIGGNKYRIVARVAYGPFFRVMIKFIGTHADYDKIDAATV